MPPCLTRISCSSHADTRALSQPYTFGHLVISRLSQSLTLGMALVMSALQKVSGCNRHEFIWNSTYLTLFSQAFCYLECYLR